MSYDDEPAWDDATENAYDNRPGVDDDDELELERYYGDALDEAEKEAEQ